MQLRNIQAGWKGFETVINKIINAVNTNEPLEGAGIRITDTSRGKLIETSDKGSSSSGDTTAAGTAPGIVTWHGVAWQDVDVVDANCNKSTITVLVQTGNSADLITIT